jgi:hypothetical protein
MLQFGSRYRNNSGLECCPVEVLLFEVSFSFDFLGDSFDLMKVFERCRHQKKMNICAYLCGIAGWWLVTKPTPKNDKIEATDWGSPQTGDQDWVPYKQQWLGCDQECSVSNGWVSSSSNVICCKWFCARLWRCQVCIRFLPPKPILIPFLIYHSGAQRNISLINHLVFEGLCSVHSLQFGECPVMVSFRPECARLV